MADTETATDTEITGYNRIIQNAESQTNLILPIPERLETVYSDTPPKVKNEREALLGMRSAVMSDLIAYATQKGRQLTLNPDMEKCIDLAKTATTPVKGFIRTEQSESPQLYAYAVTSACLAKGRQ